MSHDLNTSEALAVWYRASRRDLPWRVTQDPYKIWISEVMLQQTTVAVVIPYFERFISSFPTVDTLASAPEEKVLSLWSGLGYYSRARNLHKAAKIIAESGGFPSNVEALLKLPGVGAYTAAAVASIAFGEEAAAIDGNVTRVIARLFDVEDECTSKAAITTIKGLAGQLISGREPGEHNQAMMELGATLCVPKNPCCLVCPVSRHCRAFANGTAALRPVKKKKLVPEIWVWEMHVARKNGKIALIRGDNGTPWLKNTWALPGKAHRWKKSNLPECDFKHSITRHRIYVTLKKVSRLPGLTGRADIKWVKVSEIGELGTSSIVEKALKFL